MSETENHGASIRVAQTSWAPYIAIGVSLIIQLGVLAFWGGGISQRVASLESESMESRVERRTLAATSSQQASEMAVLKNQYEQIIKRLDKIDNKLDQPVRIR